MSESKRGVLWTSVALVAVLGVGFVGHDMLSRQRAEVSSAQVEEAQSVKDSDDAPVLADYDATVYTASGEPCLLSEIADGRPLVINFWATWCPYCVEELPDFQDIYAKYGDRVSFAFVDVADGQRERPEDAAAWLVEQGFDELPAYYDTSLEATASFGASALPTTVVVAADGTVVWASAGRIDAVLLRSTLEQLV